MNWTKTTPLEGVKYIVRTDKQNLFPAYWENGGWWHSSSQTEIFNVCTWVIYPERYSKSASRNPDVPPEVTLKYVLRDYHKLKEIAKGESEKVRILKEQNKNLVTEYNKLLLAHRELQKKHGQDAFVAEAKLEAKRVKNRELSEQLAKLTEKTKEGNSERVERLKQENEQLREELKLVRKQARKGRTLHGNLHKLLERFAALDDDGENQTTEEFVEQEKK